MNKIEIKNLLDHMEGFAQPTPRVSRVAAKRAAFFRARMGAALVGLMALALIPAAHAAVVASPPLYGATLISTTGSGVVISPGGTKLVTVVFKNAGVATWRNQGPNFVSIYTMDPKYRASDFADVSWRKPTQPAILKDASVPHGTTGTISFLLHAPKTPGSYTETFQLASEGAAFIPGGKFTVGITVPSGSVARAPTPTATPTPVSTPTINPTPHTLPPTPSSTNGYAATLLLRSHKTTIPLGPGETVQIILGFKNSGTKIWNAQTLKNTGVQIAAAASTASFHHISWAGPQDAVQSTTPVKPGELGFFQFTMQAPNLHGTYEPHFTLNADDVAVPGGDIDIPVTVTSDGMSSGTPVLAPIDMISEPTIRVGLYTTTAPTMLLAAGDYDIYDGATFVETVPSGQPSKIIFDFNYQRATVTTPLGTHVLGSRVRFVPKDPLGVFTIPSYAHPTGWNASLNDNTFRGTIELYYIPSTANLWVIDELPIEYYLRGLGETSNYSASEFQKALITAARTYAYYHVSRNTKHGGYFHVDATYDQVYLGYGNEIRTPTLTAAVEATRGMIVMYQGQLAITPYYSRSDGRTRSWKEVWGGDGKPWLVSVPTPYDVGKTLWGHGVGMSARDALYRANAGALWDGILRYYYTDTDLARKWN